MSKYEKQIENAAGRLAEAVAYETRLEDERITEKLAAIDRIMLAGDNPFTSKPHSFSSAEAIVNTDSVYREYLARQREAVRERILARGAYESALVNANLAVKETA